MEEIFIVLREYCKWKNNNTFNANILLHRTLPLDVMSFEDTFVYSIVTYIKLFNY